MWFEKSGVGEAEKLQHVSAGTTEMRLAESLCGCVVWIGGVGHGGSRFPKTKFLKKLFECRAGAEFGMCVAVTQG